MIRRVVSAPVVFTAMVMSAVAQDPQPPKFTPEEQQLAAEALKLNFEGIGLFQKGDPAAAVEKMRRSLELRRKLYPQSKYPDGHALLAQSLNNVGALLEAMSHLEQALPFHREGLEMRRKLYPASKFPDGNAELSVSLENLGILHYKMGQFEQALPFARQALDMNRKFFAASRFPDGHARMAGSLTTLGAVLKEMGQLEQVVPIYRDALEMNRKLYPASRFPDGHPQLADSLNNMGALMQAMGQAEEALPFYQQSLDMNRKLFPSSRFPDGHPQLALSLNNMGFALNSMGQLGKALNFFRPSLEMYRKLYPAARYPDGHPQLSNCLANLGYVLNALGDAEQAMAFYQQSLDMNRRLYPASKFPDGHAQLAQDLNNVGLVLKALDRPKDALASFQQSLEMFRKLFPASRFPDGHPQLAQGLNGMGVALEATGRAKEAVTYFQQSVAMYRKLYPESRFPHGHRDLAAYLSNLGLALHATGRTEEALTVHRESLGMHQNLMKREALTASEAAAFDLIATQPMFLDAYLSVEHSSDEDAAEHYAAITPLRSMVTRLLEQRHANARAAGTATGDKIARLRATRRRTEQLLLDGRMNQVERDKLLVGLADERDTLERELAVTVPALKRWTELDRLGPTDLVRTLPPGAAFIDLIAYTRFVYDGGGGHRRVPSYTAFVLAKGQPILRVELGEAKPIDAAVRGWREAVTGESRKQPPAARADLAAVAARHGEKLRRLVWGPIAKRLPAATNTVYVAPDGDLARLPWAALPVGKGRLLLEDFAVAVVSHGTFLLDQLNFPRASAGAGLLLTVGGVEYGSEDWPALPGSAAEVKAITALAPGKLESLAGAEASSERLSQALAKARYAHVATHGQFHADELTAEKKRVADALASGQPRASGRIAAKNPLGYVGLVLAKGEIMSGLSIVDLPLGNLKLATLSACETGLGEYTGGEGVQGLQRAFHLAGCPNVVASLWKVNDAATAALMTKFYHEMWVNKKPPIEALREAQLTIYRHPELIPDLAGERGPVRLREAVAARIDASAKRQATADTKLWAAFVLSGVGK